MGQAMIDLAKEYKIRQFAYLSVFHPYIDALPSHRMKLLVQQYLLDSGIPYTIPSAHCFHVNHTRCPGSRK